MTSTETTSHPSKTTSHSSLATRRAGYVVAIVVNATMLYLVNGWPGWAAVPFLTDSTAQVVGVVNAAIVAGIAVNVAYLLHDALWLRALGDLVTTGIGLVALLQIWRVFPFAFQNASMNWAMLVRFVLVVAIIGSIIGLMVHVFTLLRHIVAGTSKSI